MWGDAALAAALLVAWVRFLAYLSKRGRRAAAADRDLRRGQLLGRHEDGPRRPMAWSPGRRRRQV